MFPEKSFTVNAFLMLADKSRTATVNGLNQLFKIKSEPNKRSKIIVADNAHEVVETIPFSDRIVRPFDVDDICDKIIAEFMSSYLGIETDLYERELNVTESIANGGAALAAYAKMQFSDDTMSEALKKPS